MERLKNYKNLFEKYLSQESFLSEPIKLYEPIQYSISRGGKRIRPVLCMLSCELYGGDVRQVMPAAIAIEVFHNFTLVHDDIMDNSPLRRGEPTVFKKWGTNTAILSGDVMFAKAYEYVAQIEHNDIKRILNIFTDAAIKVCEGQQFDIDFETKPNVTISDYMNMIKLKTAVLMGASLKIGAIIAGADDDQTELMYDIGVQMGIVFQLQDDLLDIYCDENVFGKKIGSDVLSCKKTYLFLKTLELLSPGDREEFFVYYTDKHKNPDEKIAYVKNIYDNYDIKRHVATTMREYHNKALALIEKSTGNPEILFSLRNFAESLLIRDV